MAANPPKEVTAENEREAWELRVKGWRQERIAAHLGIDQSTVSRMLRRQETKLHKEFSAQAKQIKARQTAQLEYIASEAMEAWDRSKEDGEVLRTVTKRLGTRPDAKDAGKTPDPYGGAEVPGMYLNADDGEELTPEESAALLADAARNEAIARGLTVVEETSTDERRGQTGDPRYLDQVRGALSDIRDIWGIDAPKKKQIDVRTLTNEQIVALLEGEADGGGETPGA